LHETNNYNSEERAEKHKRRQMFRSMARTTMRCFHGRPLDQFISEKTNSTGFSTRPGWLPFDYGDFKGKCFNGWWWSMAAGTVADCTWKVTVNRTNAAPVARPLPDSLTVNAGDSAVFTISLSDLDGDSVSYVSGSTTPSFTGWLVPVIGANQWQFRYKTLVNMAGQYSVALIFRDKWKTPLYDTAIVKLVITSANHAPQFAITPMLATATVGQYYADTINVSDPDNDSLTLTPLAVPTGLIAVLPSPLSQYVYVSWTPTTPISQMIKLKVSDPKGASNTLEWKIMVRDTGFGYWSDSAMGKVDGAIQAIAVNKANAIVLGTEANGMYYSSNNGVSFLSVPGLQKSIQGIVFTTAMGYATVSTDINTGNGHLYSTKGVVTDWDLVYSWGIPYSDIVSSGRRIILCVTSPFPYVLSAVDGDTIVQIKSGLPSSACFAQKPAIDSIANSAFLATQLKKLFKKDLKADSIPWDSVGTLPDTATALLCGLDGKLYLGTGQGLYMSPMPPFMAWSPVNALPRAKVLDILTVPQSKDIIVIFDGTPNAIGSWVLASGKEWRYIGMSKYVTPGRVAVGPNGTVYLGCKNGKVYKYIR
jgi:hypothetical protein